MFLSCLVFAMSLCASVNMCFVVTCWERADLLALVCGVCCEFVTFPLVSWVRCGTYLYRFLIFAPLLTLNLSITNGIVSSKIYDKRDDFNFEIVNFLFLDGDVPRSPSYGVHISQLISFARVCSNVVDFNNRNLFLTAKLLKQGYRYHKK